MIVIVVVLIVLIVIVEHLPPPHKWKEWKLQILLFHKIILQ